MNVSRWAGAAAWAGGVIAAAGLVSIGWSLNWWWTGDGMYSPEPFFLAAVLSVLGLLVLLGFSRSSQGRFRTARGALLACAVLFGASGCQAGFADTREMFVGAAMENDLKYLVQVEDQLRRDSGQYLAKVPSSLLAITSGMHGPVVTLTPGGWSAEVRNDYSSRTCAVFVGAKPLPPAIKQREPRCTRVALDLSSLARGLGVLAIGLATGLGGGIAATRPSLAARAA